jgi:hypothetical protein
MDKFTAKTIHLYGDKKTKTEPAQHIITFPGGSVEVSRCDDGTYWAHIARNRADQHPPNDVGVFLSGRIDSDGPNATRPISIDDTGVYHVAIRIGKADPKAVTAKIKADYEVRS